MGRNEFTEEDRDRLARFLFHVPQRDRSKPSTHEKVASKLPNHTPSSWHEHYRKKKDDINKRIERYRRELERKEKGQEAAAEEEEDQLASDGDDAPVAGPSGAAAKKKGKERARSRDESSQEEDEPQPVKKQRRPRGAEFDDRVDLLRLAKMMLKQRMSDTLRKGQVYTILEETYDDHGATSWQSYYSRRHEQIDAAVADAAKAKGKGKPYSLERLLQQYAPPPKVRGSRASTVSSVSSAQQPVASTSASTSAARKPSSPRKSTSSSTSRAGAPAAPVASGSGSGNHVSQVQPKKRPSSGSGVVDWIERRPSQAAKQATGASASAKGKGKAREVEPEVEPELEQDVEEEEEEEEEESGDAGDDSQDALFSPLPHEGAAATSGAVTAKKSAKARGKERAISTDLEEEEEEAQGEPPFTDADDDALVLMLARGELGDWDRENVFTGLAQKYPHHPASSWRARYVDNKFSFMRRVAIKGEEVQVARARKEQARERMRQEQAEQERAREEEERTAKARRKKEKERKEQEQREKEKAREEQERKERERREKERRQEEAAAAIAAPRARLNRNLEPPTPPPVAPASRASAKANLPAAGSPSPVPSAAVALPVRPAPPIASTSAAALPAEESQLDPFTQALVARAAHQEDSFGEEEEYGGGMDDTTIWDETVALATEARPAEQGGEAGPSGTALLPAAAPGQAAAISGNEGLAGELDEAAFPLTTQASASSLPRLSQYSVLPSPFLAAAESQGEGDGDVDVDELQSGSVTDEDDRILERQLLSESTRARIGADQQQVEVKMEIDQVEVTEQAMEVDVAVVADVVQEEDVAADSDFDDADDLSDPDGPVWSALSAVEESFHKELFQRNAEQKKAELAAAAEVKLEATPDPEPDDDHLAAGTEQHRQQQPPHAPPVQAALAPARSPSPPQPSPQNRKRTRTDRHSSAPLDSQGGTLPGPDGDGSTEASQLPPARKRQRVEGADDGLRAAPKEVLQAVSRNQPLPRADKKGKGKEREVVEDAPQMPPRPPAARASQPSASASAARATAATSARPARRTDATSTGNRPSLRDHLQSISTDFQLPFNTVRDLYFRISPNADWTLARDIALLHSPLCPPQGDPEYARLRARAEASLWSLREDQQVLEGTEAAHRAINVRKGEGAVAGRRTFLENARMRVAGKLKRDMYDTPMM
ncbi:hypothetical protein JCM10213_005570 [Rhodosporidiobolus nylandii]